MGLHSTGPPLSAACRGAPTARRNPSQDEQEREGQYSARCFLLRIPVTSSSPPESNGATTSVHSAVVLLAAASFFSGAALRVCDGLLPRLAGDFGLSAGAAGRVVIAFSIAYSAMQLLFGPLGDRFGKARMVSVALAGCAALSLLASLAPGFDALVLARVGWGMAAAGIVPLALAWIGDAVPYEERQPMLARLLVGTLSGMTLGQVAGGLFADSALGWRGAFFTMAVGYALIATLLALRVRHMAVVRSPAGGWGLFHTQLRVVLGTPWSWRVLGACLLEGMFLLGPMAFLPTMMHQRFGLTLAVASGLFAFYAVGGLLYALFARRIVAALGERRMVTVGGWLMGAGYAAWLISPWVWTAAPVALAVGFGTYLFHNTLQTHATQMAPSARGTSVAMFAFSLFMGQAMGASLAGYLFDQWGWQFMLVAPAVVLPAVGQAFGRALSRRGAHAR